MKTEQKKPVFVEDFTGTMKPTDDNTIIIDKSRSSWLDKMRRIFSASFFSECLK